MDSRKKFIFILVKISKSISENIDNVAQYEHYYTHVKVVSRQFVSISTLQDLPHSLRVTESEKIKQKQRFDHHYEVILRIPIFSGATFIQVGDNLNQWLPDNGFSFCLERKTFCILLNAMEPLVGEDMIIVFLDHKCIVSFA